MIPLRDGVQTDVVVAIAQPVERVQPADRRVPLENDDALLVMRQAYARRQPRQPGSDDNGVVHRGSWFSVCLVLRYRRRPFQRRTKNQERGTHYTVVRESAQT